MKLLPCCYMVIHSYQDSDFQMPFENDLHKISYDTAVKKSILILIKKRGKKQVPTNHVYNYAQKIRMI